MKTLTVEPKYNDIRDYIDKNRVGHYKVESLNNVHTLILYPKDGQPYQYEFPPNTSLDEINNLVAYIRSRVI